MKQRVGGGRELSLVRVCPSCGGAQNQLDRPGQPPRSRQALITELHDLLGGAACGGENLRTFEVILDQFRAGSGGPTSKFPPNAQGCCLEPSYTLDNRPGGYEATQVPSYEVSWVQRPSTGLTGV